MTTYFLHMLFGTTLLLTVALTCTFFLRRRSASVRHSVLAAAVIGVLIVPLLLPMLPHWSLGIVAATKNESIHESREPNNVERPDYLSSIPVESGHSAPLRSRLSLQTDYEENYNPLFEEGEHFAPQNGGVVTLASLITLANLPIILFTLWAIGSALFFLRLALSLRAASKLIAKTMPMDEPMLATIIRRLKITTPIALRQSEVGIVPFTFGLRKPVIVLPETATLWSTEERRAVLTHELSHVARRDVFWQFLTAFCCAIYWFHPLVWFTAWRLRVEREIACDDLVVLAGEEAPVYASILLRLAGGLKNISSRRHVLGCTVAMARHHEVKQRIAAILNPNLFRKPLGRFGSAVFLCAAVVAIGLTATLSPTGKTITEHEVFAGENEPGTERSAVSGSATTQPTVIPPQSPTVTMSKDDVFVFDKGIWTNTKTGKEIPPGTVVQGKRDGTVSTFRLDVDAEGFGSVVRLTGDGSSGRGRYIEFSEEGNSVMVSLLTFDQLEEIKKAIIMGDDDVFVFDEGVWKDTKTGREFPPGTLIQGTRGVFRLDKKDDEGQIVLVAGGGAVGHGKYIRWSHGGNTMGGTPLPTSTGDASNYKTPEGGYTHLVLFAGKGSFEPRTPQGLSGKLNTLLPHSRIATGYFRTWADNNRLIGGICTADATELQKVIELIPDLELISVTPLNEQSFKQHSDKEQESLPEAEWRAMKDGEKDAKPIPNGLLQSIQGKRRAIQSADYTVRWITQNENETSTRKTSFRFQGKNQWFADVSEIMQSNIFQTGSDGKIEWSFIHLPSGEIHYNTRNLSDIKEISLSFLDPFGFFDESVKSLDETVKKRNIKYFGEAEIAGVKRHIFGYEIRQDDERRKSLTRIEITFNAETLLPEAVRTQIDSSFAFGGETRSNSSKTTLIYDIVSTNKELSATAFLPSKTEGTKPTLKEKADEGYDQFFVQVNDGSGGRMSVRAGGQRGPKGTMSGGLN